MRFELRPYQDEAVDFLVANPFAGLFIDMGLGKTAVILHALLEMPRPVLLVGPIRVIETVWRKEASLWASTQELTFSLVRGTKAKRQAALDADADIYLVNPEMLTEVLASSRKFAVLVLDESSLFKNASTTRFKTLRRALPRFQRRIISTGTPAPNSLMELWTQTFILDRGDRLFTSFSRFKQTYFHQTDWQGFKFAPHDWARDEILNKISDIVFRVSSEGALPPRSVIRNVVECPLPIEAKRVYAEMEAKAFSILAEDTTLTAATAAVVMMKLRQVASGFVYDDDGEARLIHSEKIAAVHSILEETGSPVILVYQFRHELAALKKAFPQGVVFESEHEEAWNRGEIPLLFLHPQSGGHGLNLQYGGHTMIVYSASFSLEQMSQVMCRIDRSGQEHVVVFHFLIAPNTVDDVLLKVLDQKSEDQSQVLQLIKEYASAKRK